MSKNYHPIRFLSIDTVMANRLEYRAKANHIHSMLDDIVHGSIMWQTASGETSEEWLKHACVHPNDALRVVWLTDRTVKADTYPKKLI